MTEWAAVCNGKRIGARQTYSDGKMNALAKVWVSGIVQGVGFRYFVYRLANQYGLTGFVKNLHDGRVYIEVEGNREVIEAFLKDVRVGHRWAHVKGMEVEWEPYSGKYKTFEIAF